MKNNLIKALIVVGIIFIPFVIASISEALLIIDGSIVYIISSVQILCLLFIFRNEEKKNNLSDV